MQIFLSFASEQKAIAEPILLALRGRGHKVFFSHDDLPSGASFDARIKSALEKSDLLVFLISPEALTKGRYTLTELTFARDRWPSPNGHVLPVMVVDTPLISIPSYLRAVNILEPQGNIAAETSVAAEKLVAKPHAQWLIVFAALGALTGVLSYLAVRYALHVPPRSSILSPRFSVLQLPKEFGDAPILPGIIFGILVAGAIYRFGTKDRFLLFIAVVLVTGTWILAYDSTAKVSLYLHRFQTTIMHIPSAEEGSRGQPSEPSTEPESGGQPSEPELQTEDVEVLPVADTISFGLGGLIGGLGTCLAVAIGSPRFRRLDSWLFTLFAAVFFGSIWVAYTFLGPNFGWLALFVLWQSAVIASIVRGLEKPEAE